MSFVEGDESQRHGEMLNNLTKQRLEVEGVLMLGEDNVPATMFSEAQQDVCIIDNLLTILVARSKTLGQETHENTLHAVTSLKSHLESLKVSRHIREELGIEE